MNPSNQLVVFALDEQSFALELNRVHRVVRAIEVTPLPHAPTIILGVVNVQGELFAVVNLRHRFHLPEREISPSDQFILVTITTPRLASSQATSTRKLALVVDGVTGIMDVETASVIRGEEVVPELEHVQGIAKLADDLIFIHNLERCLSLQEEQMLDNALAEMATDG